MLTTLLGKERHSYFLIMFHMRAIFSDLTGKVLERDDHESRDSGEHRGAKAEKGSAN